MRIVVTGGAGFLGRNLRLRLAELGHADVRSVDRETPVTALPSTVADAEFVFHLAGVNRPEDPAEFDTGNRGYTAAVCDALAATGRPIPLVLTSSTQATLDNPYGESKRAAEEVAVRYAAATGAPVSQFRLTNVFGKWARPNYNSVVATFCHNIARALPITIRDPAAPLRLVYIDDVVDALAAQLGVAASAPGDGVHDVPVAPVYDTTVGDVAALLRAFVESRATGVVPRVGAGLERALYATYVSYLPPEAFAYPLHRHVDPRGVFAEMLKTTDSGQFSFFTAAPGVTRGGHYHHTKTEKFLVLHGRARFGFRNVDTGERHVVEVSGAESRVVETVPGWAHDVTNIGDEELICMLWANEIFDPAAADTFAASVIA